MLDPGPIPTFLDRTKNQLLVGTYTILNTYKDCPHQMFRRYIAKDLGPFVETPEMKWGNDVHKAFEERIAGNKPLPVEMQQWEPFAIPLDSFGNRHVELKLGIRVDGSSCDFWAKDVWFRGKLDVAVIQGDKAYILDWKTGNSKYEDPLELETGAILLRARHPNLTTLKGNYIWLKENRAGGMYELSDTNTTFAKVKHLMEEIERDRVRGWFEKRQSGLCGYCNVESCEHWRERK